MGGSIHILSAPGQGSCFRIEIRVQLAQESEAVRGPDSRRVTALAAGQPEYRILIVEDQQENWMVLKRLLVDCGFLVRVALHGAQGVKEFVEWRPQFIWMDLQMPVVDGFEATALIRAAEGGREVKIAAVTASGFDSRQKEVLAAGFDDYIRKP